MIGVIVLFSLSDDFGTRLETLNWHLKMRTFVTGHTLSADDVQLFVAFTRMIEFVRCASCTIQWFIHCAVCPHWLPIYGTNRRLSIKYICRWYASLPLLRLMSRYKYLEMLDAFRSAKDSYAQTGTIEIEVECVERKYQ